MTPDEFSKYLKMKAKEIEQYGQVRFTADAGNIALRFINGNFRAQGWQGSKFTRWKPNKNNSRILIKTGQLRAGNYYTTGPGAVVVKNTLPYASIHNEGGTVKVPVTPRMRKFAWAMYYKEAGKGLKTTSKGYQYQSIGIGSKANKWKGLALTKKEYLNINIDQRQFAPTEQSKSPILERAIERKISTEINKILNK